MMRIYFLVGVVATTASWLVSSIDGFVVPSSAASSIASHLRTRTFDDNSGFCMVSSSRSPTSSTDKASSSPRPMILEVESHADWLELIEDEYNDNGDDVVTVVTFTASWCKFCQRFLRKWKHKVFQQQQQQQQHQHQKNNHVVVQFASVEYGSNRQLCRSLGIDALPTVRFYHRGTLVNSLSCGPKKFKMALETLTAYLGMTPKEIEYEAFEFANAKHDNGNDDSNAKSRPTSNGHIEIMEEEEEEEDPALYMRKRDRLKQKLFDSGKQQHQSNNKDILAP